MIDTHAHLDFPDFRDDLDAVLTRAQQAGLTAIIAVGTNGQSNKKAVALARSHDSLYAAIGIHPNDSANATENDWSELETLTADPRVVGIGETGLDFYRERCPRDAQEKSFRRTLDLAAKVGRPVIIHCREAYGDCLRVLSEMDTKRLKGVMHCFSGNADQAKAFLRLGLYISFAGQLTYPSAKDLRETAKTVPLERTLLETDCPFLAPQAHRGKRNEPAYVKHTMEQLTELHKMSPADVDRITSVNAYRLFGVGDRPPRGSIAYTIRNARYLNLTNRCPNRCIFCTRRSDFYVKGYHLRLDAEPSLSAVISSAGDLSKYDEVVFAGLGEPTLRLDIVKAVAKQAKQRGVKTRLNTNGQGSLLNGRDICPELAGLIDCVSINLATTDPAVYRTLCRPENPSAHQAVMAFVEAARKAFPGVEVTTVDIPDVHPQALKAWAEAKGVRFRLRTPGIGG
ncbi:MAG: YchF/TatD family DNA exonuclease [Planctomycetes bacterium]|nr:YchF/TatD family DNA exonuclease [Planctomycetota bacterium]